MGGLERVYELGKDFRNESVSYKHAPEFTQAEWYEAYADYEDTMRRIEELVETVARETIGTTKVTFRGHEIDLAAPWKRVKLVDALEERGLWNRDEAELRKLLDERGVDTSADKDWAQLVDHALSNFVEPELIEPTILQDYPFELSPFARATDDDPEIVERYFVGGMELGNAFRRDQRRRRSRRNRGAAAPSGRGRRGPLLRNAADRRARLRCRPVGDGAGGPGQHRDVVLFPQLRERA